MLLWGGLSGTQACSSAVHPWACLLHEEVDTSLLQCQVCVAVSVGQDAGIVAGLSRWLLLTEPYPFLMASGPVAGISGRYCVQQTYLTGYKEFFFPVGTGKHWSSFLRLDLTNH